MFLEVMTREYEDPDLFADVHQLSVDAYAVQHAGGAHPDKSIDVHAVGLFLVLERGLAPNDVPRRLQTMSERVAEWPHFELPMLPAKTTVALVSEAETPAQHAERVKRWAREVWQTWSLHHRRIAELAQLCFADGAPAGDVRTDLRVRGLRYELDESGAH